MTNTLTAASHELFMQLARDAGNWNGCPMVDVTPEQRGNLTDLKRSGLLSTFTDEGIVWADFTEAGRKYAAEHGVTVRMPA